MNKQECREKTKSFFSKVKELFEKEYAELKAFVDRNILPTIKFLTAVKTAVNNPTVDLITALTQTDLDDKIVKAIRQYLPTAIAILEIKLECADSENSDELVSCLVNHLRDLPEVQRSAMYSKLASVLTKLLVGKQNFDDHEIDSLIQLAYSNLKTQEN